MHRSRLLAANDVLLSRIEDAGLNASAPPQQHWLDGWLVRLSPGKAKRARCINAVAVGRRPLDDKLAQCAALYREARLPMFLRITPFTQPATLDAELDARGYTSIDDTRVMVQPALAAPDPPALPPGLEEHTLAPAHFAQVVGALRGSPAPERAAQAERLAASPAAGRFCALQRDGEWLACGQSVREGDLVGIYDVVTAAAHRSQGLASLLCERLLALAARNGAQVGYLLVDADNHAARRIYHRLGFTDAYAYHYRLAPAEA
jgi:ribosomal protein S18 acetylase RimI-like enzyme